MKVSLSTAIITVSCRLVVGELWLNFLKWLMKYLQSLGRIHSSQFSGGALAQSRMMQQLVNYNTLVQQQLLLAGFMVCKWHNGR